MVAEGSYPTTWWHRLDDGRVQCDVCPRACTLHEGQRGLCFVRAREGDEIVLTTYGRSSGFCVDPIEKKPLNHFLPGHVRCCRSARPAATSPASSARTGTSPSRARSTRSPTRRSPEAIAARPSELGCRSVAFTYNDPVIFLEYAIDVADACRARGIQTVAVTAGYVERRAARASSSPTWTRPTSISRRSPRTSTTTSAAGNSRRCSTTLEYLAHETDVWFELTHAADPRAERLRRRARRDDALGRRAPRPRRADALHRVPSRLEDARPPADAAADARPRPIDRDGQRGPLRVHGQRRRPRTASPPGAPPAMPCWSTATVTRSTCWGLDLGGSCARAANTAPGCSRRRPGRGATAAVR